MNALRIAVVTLGALALVDVVLLLLRWRAKREQHRGGATFVVHIVTVASFGVVLLLAGLVHGLPAVPLGLLLVALGVADVVAGLTWGRRVGAPGRPPRRRG